MVNKNPSSSDDPDHHFAPPPVPTNTDYRHARWPSFSDPAHVPAQPETTPSKHPDARKLSRVPFSGPKVQTRASGPVDVLVVGVCSSGKSTLVSKLREAGYNARACAQEHSYVPHLWQLSNPKVLIYLDASLHTIRRRRRAKWHQDILDVEHRRLSHAREHCDLYIPTDGLLPEDVASRAAAFLRNKPGVVKNL